MFKLIFRFISLTLFIIFLTIGLAFWKGGEPFRVLGEGTVIVGEKLSDFGDFVDGLVNGGKEARKTYDKLREVVELDKTEKK
ncbi:MAG: hypothetical protein ISR96_05125 [Nitrospira sp.]|nr:hypothetical protein [bacterium]MBL7048883.1 hypothetical protein [Nitrospira sp.]